MSDPREVIPTTQHPLYLLRKKQMRPLLCHSQMDTCPIMKPRCSEGSLSSSTLHIYSRHVTRGAVRSAASSYAAMRMVAGSRPVLVIA